MKMYIFILGEGLNSPYNGVESMCTKVLVKEDHSGDICTIYIMKYGSNLIL